MATQRMILYGQRFQLRHRAIVRKYKPEFFNILKRQYQSAVDMAKAHGVDYLRSNLDKIVHPVDAIPVLKNLYQTAAFIESNQTLKNIDNGYRAKRLGSGNKFRIGFDDLAPIIDEYFRIYQWNESAFPISETTKKTITRYLINQVDAGVPLDQALTAFQTLAIDSRSSLSRNRADFIAQTESHRSMNFGGMIGAYMSGVDLDKIWVTAHDARVRPTADHPTIYSHRDLEGTEQDLLKPFFNAEQINYPGDPTASMENIAGCRCSLIYLEKKKPKPIDLTRLLANFITDFFIGYVTNAVTQLIANQQDNG